MDSLFIDGKLSTQFSGNYVLLRLSDIEVNDKERTINGQQCSISRGVTDDEYLPYQYDSIGEYHYRWLYNGDLHYEGCLEETLAPDNSKRGMRLNSRNEYYPHGSGLGMFITSCKFNIYGDNNQYLRTHITPGIILKMHYVSEQ